MVTIIFTFDLSSAVIDDKQLDGKRPILHHYRQATKTTCAGRLTIRQKWCRRYSNVAGYGGIGR